MNELMSVAVKSEQIDMTDNVAEFLSLVTLAQAELIREAREKSRELVGEIKLRCGSCQYSSTGMKVVSAYKELSEND